MIRAEELNTQQQTKIVWPAERRSVARAYLDQLTRSKGIQAERARAVGGPRSTVSTACAPVRKGRRRALSQLDDARDQLEGDAGARAGATRIGCAALAATLKGPSRTVASAARTAAIGRLRPDPTVPCPRADKLCGDPRCADRLARSCS